jgi:hypothetical protein
MRKLLLLGAALCIASPFLAQPGALAQPPVYDDEPVYEEDGDEDEPVRIDPRQMRAMGAVMDRLIGAVMDIPVGGIAEAVDPLGRSGYRRGDTVRDMAERDDPHVEERLRAGVHGTTRSMTAMSEALTRMMPVLQRSLRDVERSFEEAMDEADLPRR